MAYSNAVFHLDLYNGNDAARTALTSCIASNPSGSITRITKADHGLVTGAVVTLSLFTAWLNGAWKITVVDANSFDLDGAVWQATADTNGTVTPFGGSSWADAWKTNNAGITAARVQAGDKIKVCKTPEPVSIGDATWNNGSRIVTLPSALTKTIANGTSDETWVASTNITITYSNNYVKIGANAIKIAIGLAFTTGKAAYYTLPSTLDLSSYQELCLWFLGYYAYSTNQFSIHLCSDTTGDVIVDTFNIVGSTVTVNSHLTAYNLPRVGGGNLGNSIRSIAVYVNTDTGTGSQFVQLTNAFATKTGGINLTTLFGKSGVSQIGEPFYSVHNIDETSIEIALRPDQYALPIYGYTGTSETVETFIRIPFAQYSTLNQSQSLNTIVEDNLEFEFGWDTTTDQLTGETVYSSYNLQGIIFQLRTGTKISGFIAVYNCYGSFVVATQGVHSLDIYVRASTCYRYYVLQSSAAIQKSKIVVDTAIGGQGVVQISSAHSCEIRIGKANVVMDSAVILYGFYNNIYITEYQYGYSPSISSITADGINTVEGGNVSTHPISCNLGIIKVINTICTSLFPVTFSSSYYYSRAEIRWLNRLGNNEHEVFHIYDNSNWQTIVKYMEETGALETKININTIAEDFPVIQELGEVNFNADTLVTVTVPLKKTLVGERTMGLGIMRNITVGIDVDIKTELADNNDWQLITLQFTPTLKGVIKLYIYMYGVNTEMSERFYTGKIQATQA